MINIVFTIVWVTGMLTWLAEIGLGIAVKGWQGEKPYVVRSEQPSHYWFIIGIQLVILTGIPVIQLLTR